MLAVVFQLGVPFWGAFGARVTGDEPFYLLTTISLIQDGDLDLVNQYEVEAYRDFLGDSVPLWTQSVPTADGRLLSPHNLGLSVLAIPAYVWDGVEGVKGFFGVLGAMTIACAYVLARRLTGRTGASLGAAVLVGVSAPMFVYATQVYPEVPAALCVVVLAPAANATRRRRPDRDRGGVSPDGVAVAGRQVRTAGGVPRVADVRAAGATRFA